MRKALTLLIALLCINLALAQNKPLACQVDASAGLRWENGQWKVSKFVDSRFILIMNGDTLTKESVSRAMSGSGSVIFSDVICKTNSFNKKIFCTDFGGYEISLDPQNLKGGMSRIWGATTAENSFKDAILVDAFTCQPY